MLKSVIVTYKVYELNYGEWLLVDVESLPISLNDFLVSQFGVDLFDELCFRSVFECDSYPKYSPVTTTFTTQGKATFVHFPESLFDFGSTYAIIIESNEYSSKIIALHDSFNSADLMYQFLNLVNFEVRDGLQVFNFYNLFYVVAVDGRFQVHDEDGVNILLRDREETRKRARQIGYRCEIIKFEDKYSNKTLPIGVRITYELNGDDLNELLSGYTHPSYDEALAQGLSQISEMGGLAKYWLLLRTDLQQGESPFFVEEIDRLVDIGQGIKLLRVYQTLSAAYQACNFYNEIASKSPNLDLEQIPRCEEDNLFL